MGGSVEAGVVHSHFLPE